MQRSDKKEILQFQKNEITEHFVYLKLSKIIKNPHNQNILKQIAADEMTHYKFRTNLTKQDVKPNRFKIRYFPLLARFLGLTFAIKLMEKWEIEAQEVYWKFANKFVWVKKIIQDESTHEHALIDILKEKKLEYIWSIVLWLNDALVELTWVLAWLTLALQNMQLIALSGLITGIAASFSMWASEYLSKKADGEWASAKVSALYTWIAYFVTVILLILPFLFLENPFVALVISLATAIWIIAVFNFYISVAKWLDFKRRFWEMVWLSMWIALFSFGIGIVLRKFLGVTI